MFGPRRLSLADAGFFIPHPPSGPRGDAVSWGETFALVAVVLALILVLIVVVLMGGAVAVTNLTIRRGEMRELNDHKVNEANDTLVVQVLDEPGSGGACHQYLVTGGGAEVAMNFQNGPINEVGCNGITHEVLLAILADRLRYFQKGPYASRYNALALTHIEDAQNWLNRRTLERMRRGVEGTHAI